MLPLDSQYLWSALVEAYIWGTQAHTQRERGGEGREVRNQDISRDQKELRKRRGKKDKKSVSMRGYNIDTCNKLRYTSSLTGERGMQEETWQS